MRRTFQRLSILTLVVLFTFSVSSDVFSKGGGGFGRSSGRSYSSRSARKTYSRPSTSSRSSSRSSSKSYSGASRSTPSTVQRSSSPAGQRTSSKSYGQSAIRSSQTGTARRGSAVRQKQNAMSRAKTGSAVSTKNMTSSQKRGLRAGQRRGTRALTAENLSLKRQNRKLGRETARARREARQARSPVNVYNFGTYYPVPMYSTYGLGASIVYGNLLAGIYFHDHYNHMIRHSWMWHYHHHDYDRSHWSRERRMEYERWRAYYDSQNVKPNSNYVDPGTNRDENYTESYVEKHGDEFYGANAVESVTVEDLPNEEELRESVLSAEAQPALTTASRTQPQRVVVEKKVIVQKKTSGATWFVLVFGSVLIIGVVVLVMYNKGYF